MTLTGLPLALWILDRLSGEHRPQVPGLFERAAAGKEIGMTKGELLALADKCDEAAVGAARVAVSTQQLRRVHIECVKAAASYASLADWLRARAGAA